MTKEYYLVTITGTKIMHCLFESLDKKRVKCVKSDNTDGFFVIGREVSLEHLKNLTKIKSEIFSIKKYKTLKDAVERMVVDAI